MANYLTLNENCVQVGLGTQTFIVGATGNYNVQFQTTVPSALATGAGAGSSADQGNGASGGTQGIGSGTALGQGGTGLGFGTATNSDNATGNGSGHGAGAGGGDVTGFARGGNGTSDGGVGQGFGPVANNYNQPPADVHTPTSGPAVSSSLVVTVKQNGTTIFTAPAFTPTQSAMQFRTSFQATAADTITINLTSSNAADEQLNTIQSNMSIGQGL